MTQIEAQPSNRRDRNADATRRDMVAVGCEIFANMPYSEITGLQICEAAGVTRGALQHHFGSKLGLFMAVFDKLQLDVIDRVLAAVGGSDEPWEQARLGVKAFLEACTSPAYQNVILKEGPAAVGWEHWRELDAEYFSAIIYGLIDRLATNGLADHPPALLLAVIRGTLTELSFEITHSDDHESAVRDALAVAERVLSSFRTDRNDTEESVSAVDDAPRARVGIGQLRASVSSYLDQTAAGARFEILRRGRVVAELTPPTRLTEG